MNSLIGTIFIHTFRVHQYYFRLLYILYILYNLFLYHYNICIFNKQNIRDYILGYFNKVPIKVKIIMFTMPISKISTIYLQN